MRITEKSRGRGRERTGRPCGLAALASVTLILAGGGAGEPLPDRYRLSGLKKPVTVSIDPWGVPHIDAQTLDDVFLAQGFVAARDRLWQMDLWRKRGLGRDGPGLRAGFRRGGPAWRGRSSSGAT